jgi:hypothetical protein
MTREEVTELLDPYCNLIFEAGMNCKKTETAQTIRRGTAQISREWEEIVKVLAKVKSMKIQRRRKHRGIVVGMDLRGPRVAMTTRDTIDALTGILDLHQFDYELDFEYLARVKEVVKDLRDRLEKDVGVRE